MRTLTAVQRAGMEAAHRHVAWRFLVRSPAGVWQDLSTLAGINWCKEASWSMGVDDVVVTPTIILQREVGDLSLAPWLASSPLNQQGNLVVPAIDMAYPCRLEVAVVPRGTEITEAHYARVFEGEIDRPSWGKRKPDLVLTARDLAGRLLDAWVRDETEYGSEAGTPVADVIQAILNDWAPGTQLRVIGDPQWAIRPYRQSKQQVLEALRVLVQGRGWDLHSTWSAPDGAHLLTLYQADALKAQSDWTFAPNRYIDLPDLTVDRARIRNWIRVGFRNRATGLREHREAKSLASYAKLNDQWVWFGIEEPDDSPIDTPEEAQSLADIALASLAPVEADQEMECPFFWPGQIGDRYTFLPNDVHYDSAQSFYATGLRHQLTRTSQRSWIRSRGEPTVSPVALLRRRPQDPRELDLPEQLVGNYEVEPLYNEEGTVATVRVRVKDPANLVTAVNFDITQGTGEKQAMADPHRIDWDASPKVFERDVPLHEDWQITVEPVLTLQDATVIRLAAVALDRIKMARITRVNTSYAEDEATTLVDANTDTAALFFAEEVSGVLGPEQVMPLRGSSPQYGRIVVYASQERKRYFRVYGKTASGRVGPYKPVEIDVYVPAKPTVEFARIWQVLAATNAVHLYGAVLDDWNRGGTLYVGVNRFGEGSADASAAADGWVSFASAQAAQFGPSTVFNLTGGGTAYLLNSIRSHPGKVKAVWLQWMSTDGRDTGRVPVTLDNITTIHGEDGRLIYEAVEAFNIKKRTISNLEIGFDAVQRENIINNAIDTAKFALGIEPVSVRNDATLPTVKSTEVITWQGNLYRWNGVAYVRSVAAVDLTGQIQGQQIVDAAITDAKLAAQAVSEAKLQVGSVTAQILAAGAVTTAKLAYAAVQGDVIAAGAITGTKISDGAIESPKIAAGAVVAGKIAAGAVAANEIAANAITAGKIAAGEILAQHVGALQITTEKLATSSVVAEKIAFGTISGDKIAAYTIAGDRIAGNTISGNHIVGNTLTGGHIAGDSISAGHLQANSVTFGKVSAGAIGADQIISYSVTANKINVGSLQEVSPNLGILVSGALKNSNGTAWVDLNNQSGNNLFLFSRNWDGVTTFWLDHNGDANFNGTLGANVIQANGIVVSSNFGSYFDPAFNNKDPITGSNLTSSAQNRGFIDNYRGGQITASVAQTIISGGAISTGHISAQTLSAIAADLGVIQAGVIRSGWGNWGITFSGTPHDPITGAAWSRYINFGNPNGYSFIHHEQFELHHSGNAFFKGTLQAAGGEFAGNLSAAGGSFNGILSAAGATVRAFVSNSVFRMEYIYDPNFFAAFRLAGSSAHIDATYDIQLNHGWGYGVGTGNMNIRDSLVYQNKDVLIGEPDSGGWGYRALRVPN